MKILSTRERMVIIMKKLYRCDQGKKVCGVCQGIAEYLNADVTVVRIVTVLIAMFCGSGIIAYIICAIVMPEKNEVIYDNRNNQNGYQNQNNNYNDPDVQ